MFKFWLVYKSRSIFLSESFSRPKRLIYAPENTECILTFNTTNYIIFLLNVKLNLDQIPYKRNSDDLHLKNQTKYQFHGYNNIEQSYDRTHMWIKVVQLQQFVLNEKRSEMKK